MSRFHLPHSKKQESHKFEVQVSVKSMIDLPSKYKLLRLELTRGAKADSTKEMVATNQRAEPNASDGTMKTLCTMYTTPGQSGHFEEKTYKLSLIRINQRSMLHKAKKIGTSYINLAEYVNLDGSSQDVKITMKCDEATKPAVLNLNIRSAWLKNFKGSGDDAMSDISGMNIETASQATSQASLNSIDEDEEDDFPPDLDDDAAGALDKSARDSKTSTPAARRTSSSAAASTLSPTAKAASSGDIQQLHDSLVKAQTELKYTTGNLKDVEKQLEAREMELDKALKDCKKLQSELEKANRVQEELMQENAQAEEQYNQLLAQHDAGESTHAGDKEKASALQAEVKKTKAEASALREEREELRKELEQVAQERAELEEELRQLKTTHSDGGAATEDLEAELESEKARSAKFKAWFEKAREQKGALESEMEDLRAKLEEGGGGGGSSKSPPKPAPPAAVGEEKGPAGAKGEADTVPRAELEEMKEEVERIAMQLVTASLGHAQAEQDRLEAKQQVYKLKDVNRKLRERLTGLELQLAKSVSK